jgi:hypothetical protein
VTHTFVDQIRSWGPIALTLHGRTRQQRYSKLADWDYIWKCADVSVSGLYWLNCASSVVVLGGMLAVRIPSCGKQMPIYVCKPAAHIMGHGNGAAHTGV